MAGSALFTHSYIHLFAFHRQGLQGPIGPQVLNHIHFNGTNLNTGVLLTRHAVFG